MVTIVRQGAPHSGREEGGAGSNPSSTSTTSEHSATDHTNPVLGLPRRKSCVLSPTASSTASSLAPTGATSAAAPSAAAYIRCFIIVHLYQQPADRSSSELRLLRTSHPAGRFSAITSADHQTSSTSSRTGIFFRLLIGAEPNKKTKSVIINHLQNNITFTYI